MKFLSVLKKVNANTSNEAESPATLVGAVYYGTVSVNPDILTVVKVIKGDSISDTKMVEISFYRRFLADKDYENAVKSIIHSIGSYYNWEQLDTGCDEKYFNELYAIALQQFPLTR